MKKELFRVFIERFGFETLKNILIPYLDKEGLNKSRKKSYVDSFFKKIGGKNQNIAPLILNNFGDYHQRIHLYQYKKSIKKNDLDNAIQKLKYEGIEGNDIIFAFKEIKEIKKSILLYVPFKVSYHLLNNEREERHHETLHTPVLIKFFNRGASISSMTFTKSDWSKLLPPDIIDSRSNLKDEEILSKAKSFINDFILKIEFSKIDFTSKAKSIIKMEEVDIYSATHIKRCEARYKTIDDFTAQRTTLKDTVPDKVEEIFNSSVILNLYILLLKPVFGLPEGSKLTLLPSSGSIRITKHIEGGNFNEIQNILFS